MQAGISEIISIDYTKGKPGKMPPYQGWQKTALTPKLLALSALGPVQGQSGFQPLLQRDSFIEL